MLYVVLVLVCSKFIKISRLYCALCVGSAEYSAKSIYIGSQSTLSSLLYTSLAEHSAKSDI